MFGDHAFSGNLDGISKRVIVIRGQLSVDVDDRMKRLLIYPTNLQACVMIDLLKSIVIVLLY